MNEPNLFEYLKSRFPFQQEHLLLLEGKQNQCTVMFRGLQFVLSRHWADELVPVKDRWEKQKRWQFRVKLLFPGERETMEHDDVVRVLLLILLRSGDHPFMTQNPITA